MPLFNCSKCGVVENTALGAANDDERYSLADIETRLADLMQYAPRGGLSISDWVASRMRSAADDADARLAATPVQNRGEDFQRGYEACREDAARYIEGHGGVIPGATVFIPLITGDNMPCMSGDGRDKLHTHKRRCFDDATRTLATAIRNMEARNG